MHASRIVDASCLGPYPKTLSVGDEQSMMFTETDQGPFYVNEPQRSENKYDQATGEKNKRDLKKSELIALLQSKIGLTLPSSNSKTLAELQTIATMHGISTQTEEDIIIQGWMNKPKGLLQILWERGWIDPNENLNDYVKEKRKKWLDARGNILPEFENDAKKFVLTDLLSECPDFKDERSAMQKLDDDLSTLYACQIKLLILPKYHCELAGEGIEYA